MKLLHRTLSHRQASTSGADPTTNTKASRTVFYGTCHSNVQFRSKNRLPRATETETTTQTTTPSTTQSGSNKQQALRDMLKKLQALNAEIKQSLDEIKAEEAQIWEEVTATRERLTGSAWSPPGSSTVPNPRSSSPSSSSLSSSSKPVSPVKLLQSLARATTNYVQFQDSIAVPVRPPSQAPVPAPPPIPSPPPTAPSSSRADASSGAEIVPSRGPANFTSDTRTLFDLPLPPLRNGSAGTLTPVTKTKNPLDLVFVTAEAAPWSKTGGLGDVMGSLPVALAQRGHRVMVVLPRYLSESTKKRYADLTDLKTPTCLDLGPKGGQHTVNFMHTHSNGVDWVFVDHIAFHREGNPYGNASGPFHDNLFRFSLLAMAACEAPLVLKIGGYHSGAPPGLPYGQKVLFIANDWHAGLVPVYLASKYRRHNVYKEARCMLAIHNLAHQGTHPPFCFDSLGVPPDWYGAMEFVEPTTRKPTINVLKAALVTSDHIMTVSQNYAWEICLGDQAMGLASLLKQRMDGVTGIVNGIDISEWNPQTDPYIARNYTPDDLRGKRVCKQALQAELGLSPEPDAPLIGFIGRLDYQKGPDLVLGALEELVEAGCQVVILGSGAPDYEAMVREAQARYRRQVHGHVGFSVPLSHKILAGCDILLMPSRFEPCGLNQMYAMRYGTVPVAHATGGLCDTIDDVNPFDHSQGADLGTGWTFTPATLPAMMDVLRAAIKAYEEQPQFWQRVQRAGMTRDFSWLRAAAQYEAVFEKVAVATTYCK